jgi:ABC-type multidrug transport system fused ATPase/permease subunit
MKSLFRFTDAFRKDILIKSEKIRFIRLLLVGVIAALTDVLVVGLLYPFITLLSGSKIQGALQNSFEFFHAETIKLQIILTCLALLAGYVARFLVFFYFKKETARFRRDIQIRFSSLVFNNYLRRDLEDFYSTNSSELVRNLSAVGSYLSTFVFGFLTLVSELTLGFGLIGLVTVFSPGAVFPALLLCLILGYLAHRLTKSKMKSAGERASSAVGGRLRVMQEGYRGISEIKLYSKEDFFKEEFAEYQKRAADAEQDFEVYSGMTSPLFELVLVSSLIAFVSIYISTSKDFALVLPTLALLAGAAFRIIPSFGRLINYMQNMEFGGAIAEDLRRMSGKDSLATKVVESNQDKSICLSDKSSLELVNLGFTYQSNQIPVFQSLNMKFEFGKIYCITGESGSGKSTLVALILGLLKPVEGDVRVGEFSISESLESWQKTIGYVPQSIFLRDDTIKRNITLGESTDQRLRLEQVIAQSGLTSFIGTQSEGVETNVGESGSKISGGERQRIGIARALFRNPSLLVFDEATNALDQETENQVLETIFSMRGEVTMIILSHNVKVVERCDVVYRLS